MLLAQQHSDILSLIQQQQWVKAHPLIVTLIQSAQAPQTSSVDPQYYLAEGYFLLGIVNAELGQFNKATQCIEQAIAKQARAEYFAYLAKYCALLGDTNRAMHAIEQIDIQQLTQPNALDTVGVSLSRIGFHDQAIIYFEKAIELASLSTTIHAQQSAQYYYNYGMSLKFAGQFTQALAAYEQVLTLNPTHAPTHFAIADLGLATPDNNHIQRLQSRLTQADLHVDDRLQYAHALALELQQLNRHPEALAVLIDAKGYKARGLNYKFTQDQALFNAIKATSSTASDITNQRHDGSCRPIFIVGMPRSGTTLVERILSHHSQVGSGGELQDFGIAVKQLTATPGQTVLDIATMEAAQQLDFGQLGDAYLQKTKRIAPESARFIDKLPFNFFYINLIQKALPDAKIIIMLRDPMDTCVGNFRQMFSLNSPYYNYAFDLESIGQFYTEFRQLMDAFLALNDRNIRVQQYETLAREPEDEVRALLDFCALPFETQCVEVQNNTLPVSTASKVQVRQPINTSSIGRWKKFGSGTLPLQAHLAQHNLMTD